jgi:SAM-dependent methyltransferase
MDWGARARRGFLASGIDPADQRGHKNEYIDVLQKMALEEVLDVRGDERVLDFGCGSGRMAYWIAPKVKSVIGLEVTAEMIELAEKTRKAENVAFMLYDGVHFPPLPEKMDLILSVGVLQIMEGDGLKRTLSMLAQYLKRKGRLYLIEQGSDNPAVGRPSAGEYLRAFKDSGLECLRHYPIRNGRWWLLFMIRYGLIPRAWFPRIAHHELVRRREERKRIGYYKDFLFVLEKG